jgi:hypothetical protein
MAYIGSPPADRILSSADIAQGAVTLNDINFTDAPTNMDITGTIDKHTMRLAEGVTITGDVTISDDLVLAKISDDGVAITMTNDGSSRTITGSGSIQAGTIIATPQPTQTYAVGTTLTGLTGVIGSEVTGGAGLDGATIADNSVTLAKIADNSVTLAKMSGGTDGELITYDASGDPATVAVGTSGHVLTSGGTGVAPTFQSVAASGGGKVLQMKFAVQNTEQTVTSTTHVKLNGCDLTITPASSSNKIVLMCSSGFSIYTTDAMCPSYYKNASDVTETFNLIGGQDGGGKWYAPTGAKKLVQSWIYVDTANTTNEITYSPSIRVTGGTGYMSGSGQLTTIIAMELDES